ncbi:hypothetical protein BHM03_00046510 [Ensete ventricosum]|nr:hypothetical protein BHM03_00046510 [Ensete ventricosum]
MDCKGEPRKSSACEVFFTLFFFTVFFFSFFLPQSIADGRNRPPTIDFGGTAQWQTVRVPVSWRTDTYHPVRGLTIWVCSSYRPVQGGPRTGKPSDRYVPPVPGGTENLGYNPPLCACIF